jgi:hypothetical protein
MYSVVRFERSPLNVFEPMEFLEAGEAVITLDYLESSARDSKQKFQSEWVHVGHRQNFDRMEGRACVQRGSWTLKPVLYLLECSVLFHLGNGRHETKMPQPLGSAISGAEKEW